MAKDVTDCAVILEALASHDAKDSTSVDREAVMRQKMEQEQPAGLHMAAVISPQLWWMM